MSFSIDTNILVYAANEDLPEYQAAQSFLNEVLWGPEIVYLIWPVLMSYFRLITNRRMVAQPLSFEAAWKSLRELLTTENVIVLDRGPGFPAHFHEVSHPLRPTGNAIPDCEIAAILHEHRINTFYTRDRDFRRFDFLKIIDPIE